MNDKDIEIFCSWIEDEIILNNSEKVYRLRNVLAKHIDINKENNSKI